MDSNQPVFFCHKPTRMDSPCCGRTFAHHLAPRSASRQSFRQSDVNKGGLFTADRREEELTGEQGFTAQSLRPHWLLTDQNGHGLFRFTCRVPTQVLINRLVHMCVQVLVLLSLWGLIFAFFPVLRLCFKVKVKIRVKVSVRQVDHLVEPEIVRLQKSLKFGEKLVVVKAIDGLHITSTVVQIPRDLR